MDPNPADPPTPEPPLDDEPEGDPHAAGHAAGGPGASLQRLASPQRPPRPPRRTGVFLDPDDLRIHVGELLRVFLGTYQVDAWNNFTFTHDGARVFVTVGATPIGPQVGVFSITNVELDLDEELARYLLETNHQLGFGAFSYEPESRAVWLKHSLLGTTLDGPELQSAVAAVASTAAHFDGAIRDRFGGRAFTETPEEEQARARPPEAPDEAYPSAGGYL